MVWKQTGYQPSFVVDSCSLRILALGNRRYGAFSAVRRHLQDHFKQDRYTFIDDSLANLQELDAHFNKTEPVLDLLLASWGYNGPDDASLAGKAGYPFITQEDLIAKIGSKSH
mgnify:CR=1 FL=1